MTNINRLRRMGIVLISVAAFASGSAGARPAIDVPPLGARVNDTAGLLSPVAAEAAPAEDGDQRPKVILNRTISEVLPRRTGGPQVPAPLVT
jgi:hypothetical protein